MDFNEIIAYLQPVIDWLIQTGTGGFIGYWLARMLSNKWFKKNDVNNLLNGFAERLTGSAIDVDLTAVTNDKLEAIEKRLGAMYQAKLTALESTLKQQTQILAHMADVYAGSPMLSDEQRTRLTTDTKKIREDEPAPAKPVIKIPLKPIKTASKAETADKSTDYIKAG